MDTLVGCLVTLAAEGGCHNCETLPKGRWTIVSPIDPHFVDSVLPEGPRAMTDASLLRDGKIIDDHVNPGAAAMKLLGRYKNNT